MLPKESREQLTEEQLKDALEVCAKEPIHIPGSIQPHGFLIAHENGRITNCSENVAAFIGRPAAGILDKTLDEVFGADGAKLLAGAVVKSPLEPVESINFMLGGHTYDVVASRSGEKTILEMEPHPAGDATYSSDKFYYGLMRQFAINIREAKGEKELHDLIVQEIFALTGIDRVKLYRFDEEWNGEVVAEAKKDYMPSYLGMRFPASDIPEQARKLYTKSYLRIIPDISYKPSPILPQSGPDAAAPLDLSQSVLRSVSPVHIQYLDNMKVRASLSISIIQNGRLWGLIACHHNSPIYIPYRVRMVAEVTGHIFSAQLSTLQAFERQSDNQKRKLLIDHLSMVIQQDIGTDKMLLRVAPLSMEALKAPGFAYHSDHQTFVFGDTPSAAQISSLMAWLKKNHVKDIFSTDHLEESLANEPELQGIRGGLLACNVTLVNGDYALWFRPTIAKEVNWAGKPEKSVEETKAGHRLTPRGSFELWKQTVKGRSAPWSPEDLLTAQDIARVLLESRKLASDQANVAKSEFMANLSHELRTPMNAILGLSDILVNSQPLSDRQRMYIATLKSSADNLLTLINDLLDVAKIESKSIELENINFDLARLLQELVSMLSVRAVEKNLALRLNTVDLEKTPFSGDPTRLRQVLINLIGNAIKFTEKGGVEISVSSLRANQPGTYSVTFEVTDTGIGIPADKIGTIFEKFTQADASINRRFGGTGLGLSITRTLVQLMGGHISVRSEMGRGSTFAFTVPLNTASAPLAPAKKEEIANVPAPQSVPKVLIVEDFEPNALVVTSLLEDFGYEYDLARNGSDAVEMAARNDYFAILMDVQMHGMNGFDATAAIRKAEEGTKIHRYIIGVTAHALAGDRERCYAAGMDDYLPKPFAPRELKSKLLAAIFALKRQES